MFRKSGPNYLKLKTNLRLCIQRLKMLEKKKSELAMKARKEIADYISAGKEDRARIRVEHIVREDYMVEGLEILEMFCDLLLARFGLIEKMNVLDPGLEECIASIIWAAPRVVADIAELAQVAQQLTAKYGKEYAIMCQTNPSGIVNEKLQNKLSIYAPPKILIENYMLEIAKAYNVPFEPDPIAMMGEIPAVSDLLDLGFDGQPGEGSHGGGGGGGGMVFPPQHVQPYPQQVPHQYTPLSYPGMAMSLPGVPSSEPQNLPPGAASLPSNPDLHQDEKPPLPAGDYSSRGASNYPDKLAKHTGDSGRSSPKRSSPPPPYYSPAIHGEKFLFFLHSLLWAQFPVSLQCPLLVRYLFSHQFPLTKMEMM
ncbi:IST1 homolog isoform X2 [Lingula anatina]|uniref:IST1 homolog n=1 Tax=Lingula anatina TaxID=7574 RepID=A0A1S3JHU1_LINAN|nr:IST1 homolog isoform X2 [Lingula anatina]|eukprot:XP_013409985.1 IST1 homolog isoform X2 [Lingula anatina]